MNAKFLKNVLVVGLLVLLLTACAVKESTSCQTECSDAVPAVPNNTDASINNSNTNNINITVDAGAGATTGQNTQAQATAEAFVFVAPSWDDTCVEQSALVGVTLTPLAEGDFYACTYHGPRVNISIPEGTYADIDLGQVFVGKGPLNVDGVSNLTLRPWTSGQESELCAHLKDLTTYGSQQTPVFTPSALNFSCPAQ